MKTQSQLLHYERSNMNDMDGVQNTKSMWMEPQSPDDFNMMDSFDNKPMQLRPIFTGDQFKKVVQYPIIVEAWDKKSFGSAKRRWIGTEFTKAEFTKAERKTIGSYYGRFYRWHLVSGTPKHVSCKLKTIELLQRAVNFFASI